jgi:hypothetical protein
LLLLLQNLFALLLRVIVLLLAGRRGWLSVVLVGSQQLSLVLLLLVNVFGGRQRRSNNGLRCRVVVVPLLRGRDLPGPGRRRPPVGHAVLLAGAHGRHLQQRLEGSSTDRVRIRKTTYRVHDPSGRFRFGKLKNPQSFPTRVTAASLFCPEISCFIRAKSCSGQRLHIGTKYYNVQYRSVASGG